MEPLDQRLYQYRWGKGDASILFSPDKTDPARAALVNATYSGSIDADDVHVGSMLHPGCVVFRRLAAGQHLSFPVMTCWLPSLPVMKR